MVNILEIDSVQLSFDNRKILQSVYLKAETGRVTGILGRNGCGKSSLLKMLYGDMKAGEKSVRINKKALLSDYRAPAKMRMLPHFSFLPPNLRVSRIFNDFNLDYSKFLNRFTEFEAYRDFQINQLSGGNVRTIEVYIILKSRTEFCLLDEPFTFLSPKNTEVFANLINEEKKKKGIVITDHHYRAVVDLSDDLYLLRNGTTSKVTGIEDLIKLGYLPG